MNPDGYPGSIREASQVIRVLLTGSTRSPALHLVAATLGEDEVRRRVGSILTH
jgi:glutamyl-tRNA synthetase